MFYSLRRVLFLITVLNLLVVHHHCRTLKRSSAPIRKSSGLQWSAPKSQGSGNVSIVILPQENSANNSDFVVAINTDYKVLSEDTHLLSLMTNDSNVAPEKDFQSMPLQLSDEVESTDVPNETHITKCSFKGTNTRYKPYTKLIQIPVKYEVKTGDKIISSVKQDDIISGNKLNNDLQTSNKKLHKSKYFDPIVKGRTSGKLGSSTLKVPKTTTAFKNTNSNMKVTKLFMTTSSLKDKSDKPDVLNSKAEKMNKISIALEMLNSPDNENIHFQNPSQIPDVHIEKIRPDQVIKVYPYQNFTIGMNRSFKPNDLTGTLNNTKRLRFADINVEAANEHKEQDMNSKFNKDDEDPFTGENHLNFDINNNNQDLSKNNSQFFNTLLNEVVNSESTQEPKEYQSFVYFYTPSLTTDTFIPDEFKQEENFKQEDSFKQENLNTMKVQEITSPALETIDSFDLPESEENVLNNKPQSSNKNDYDIVLVIPPIPNQLSESKQNMADETHYLLNIAKQETVQQPDKTSDFMKQSQNIEEHNDFLNKPIMLVSYNMLADESTVNIESGELATSVQPQTGNLLNRTSINLMITNNDPALHMLNKDVSVKGHTSNTYSKDGSSIKEQKPSLTINLYDKNNSNK